MSKNNLFNFVKFVVSHPKLTQQGTELVKKGKELVDEASEYVNKIKNEESNNFISKLFKNSSDKKYNSNTVLLTNEYDDNSLLLSFCIPTDIIREEFEVINIPDISNSSEIDGKFIKIAEENFSFIENKAISTREYKTITTLLRFLGNKHLQLEHTSYLSEEKGRINLYFDCVLENKNTKEKLIVVSDKFDITNISFKSQTHDVPSKITTYVGLIDSKLQIKVEVQ